MTLLRGKLELCPVNLFVSWHLGQVAKRHTYGSSAVCELTNARTFHRTPDFIPLSLRHILEGCMMLPHAEWILINDVLLGMSEIMFENFVVEISNVQLPTACCQFRLVMRKSAFLHSFGKVFWTGVDTKRCQFPLNVF